MRSRLLRVLPALLLCALALSACNSGSGSSGASPAKRLHTALAKLSKAEALNVSMSTDALPTGVTTGLLSATGVGTHAPAFKGTVKLEAGGLSLTESVISVDGKLWAKGGIIPAWTTIDPATVNAPDPAKLIGTGQDGFVQLFGDTTSLKRGKKVRDGNLVLTTVTGRLPADQLAELMPTADPKGAFTVTYRLTDSDVLQSTTIKGPIYKGKADASYDIVVKASDDKPVITAPKS